MFVCMRRCIAITPLKLHHFPSITRTLDYYSCGIHCNLLTEFPCWDFFCHLFWSLLVLLFNLSDILWYQSGYAWVDTQDMPPNTWYTKKNEFWNYSSSILHNHISNTVILFNHSVSITFVGFSMLHSFRSKHTKNENRNCIYMRFILFIFFSFSLLSLFLFHSNSISICLFKKSQCVFSCWIKYAEHFTTI